MLSLKDVSVTRGLTDFKWEKMARQVIFKTFYPYPNRDFMVTPINMLENGTMDERHPMEALFDCPLYPTAFMRNLYRLYTTIAYVTKGVQLGLPMDHVSKLRAVEIGHPYILSSYFIDDPGVAAALSDIYSVMFDDIIVHPPSTAVPLAMDII